MLKVHSRCDLACDHCYIYEHADQSWLTRPHRIAAVTVRTAATRIAEHAATHHLPETHVVLHGGEPLLLGPRGLREALGILYEQIAPVTRLDLSIHTNGVLLDEEFCDVFNEYGVRVGVSLDGDHIANDRHRRFAGGRSSHAEVMRALRLLRTPEYRHLYAGILCTVDIANDAAMVYDALITEQPPRIDFLLPHATWDNPPPRPEGGVAAPYALWLGLILDRWVAQGRPIPIRLFESIEAALRGEPSWTEGVGLDPVDLLVVETDGAWEQVDSLKTAYAGAAATNLDVFSHSVDEAARHPAVASRQQGVDVLCETCRRCPVVAACGGGLYPHRYRTGSGFENPSVYCDDLKELVGRVSAAGGARRSSGTSGHRRRTSATQPPLPTIRIEDVEKLADGPIGSDLIERFADTQAELTRTLFAQVGATLTQDAASRQPIAAAGWELLCSLDERAPEAAREIYRHPHARAWAVRCLIRPSNSLARDLMQLAVFAAACAVHAGQDADLTVPVDGGRLYLPTLGTRVFGSDDGTLTMLRVRAGVVETGDDWPPTVLVGPGVHVLRLEDQDPYRDCYDTPPTGPMASSEVHAWNQATLDAGTLLRQTAPGYAAQMEAALRAIVPLAPDPAGAERSATSRHAFGSAGIALPASGRALASLVVHEVQHMLLNAVLDLHDLFDPTDRRRLHVAWRPDPRPLSGVLHGAFAHLAMAEVWKAFDHQDDGRARRYADWSNVAVSTLLSTGALTPLGESFGSRLAERARAIARS